MKTYIIKLFSFLLAVIPVIINAQISESDISYIFPKPGSKYNAQASNIILRLKEETRERIDTPRVKILGNKHGIYDYESVISQYKKTYIFKPLNEFIPGEIIEVIIYDKKDQSTHYSYKFTVTSTPQYNFSSKKSAEFENKGNSAQFKTVRQNYEINSLPVMVNGKAVPSDFPVFTPSVNTSSAPGYIFLNNWQGAPYIMILENDGTPYYWEKVALRARDFKVQTPTMLSRRKLDGNSGFITMDQNFNTIKLWQCQNGYGTDEHEFQYTSEGTGLMIGLDYQTIDMSAVGGPTDATVIGNHIQEIDESNNVVFEWRSWDNFLITDAIHENLTSNSIDYVHMNAIAVDFDGNLLCSSRHLSECTKIDRNTGDIIWRLGGENNGFTFTNDPDMISYQHDIRPVPGVPNHYTIFDNGNYKSPQYSRAVEFYLDTVAMTAEKVWEYRHSPDRYTYWMGNVQRLPNGNTFINWADGSLPKATEVTSAGDIVYEGNFEDYIHCYRAFRFEWDGMLLEPRLEIENYPDVLLLIFNKFGDDDVTGYNVYLDQNTNPTTLYANTTDNYLIIDDLESGEDYYVKVTATYSNGSESSPSEITHVIPEFTTPGENLIRNGDFSDEDNYWDFSTNGGASATGNVTDEKYTFSISSTGSEYWHVQLKQENLPLITGKDYILEFDAYASSSRIVEIKVIRAQDPWTNYSQSNPTYIVETEEHYSYSFTMNELTDLNARIEINCGVYGGDVTIDNLVLREDVDIINTQLNDAEGLIECYPNPVTDFLTIKFTNYVKGSIQIEIYDYTGRLVNTVNADNKSEDNLKLDFTKYTDGIYFIKLKHLSDDNKSQIITPLKVIKY